MDVAQSLSSPTRIRRKARTIPFGYRQCEDDPWMLEPVPLEEEALKQAAEYIKTCSYKQVTDWLERATGREITGMGLRKAFKKRGLGR